MVLTAAAAAAAAASRGASFVHNREAAWIALARWRTGRSACLSYGACLRNRGGFALGAWEGAPDCVIEAV